MSKEKFYDEEVAPMLAKLAKQCASNNMPFMAMVGNEKDNYTTCIMPDDSNPAVRIAYMALQAQGNVDKLFMMIEADAAKYGDNSMYLEMLRAYRKLINPKK